MMAFERFLFVPAIGEVKVLQLDGDDPGFFDTLRETIGADVIESVHCGPYLMLVDDVGALDILNPLNLFASTLYPGSDYGEFIHGDVLIGALGFRNSEPDIVGLDPKQIRILLHWFEVVSATGNVPDEQ